MIVWKLSDGTTPDTVCERCGRATPMLVHGLGFDCCAPATCTACGSTETDRELGERGFVACCPERTVNQLIAAKAMEARQGRDGEAGSVHDSATRQGLPEPQSDTPS